MIKEIIDSAVANNEWLQINPKATVHNLTMEESDHCPILIDSKDETKKFHRPFRFFQAWTTDTSRFYIVKKAWEEPRRMLGMECHKLVKSHMNTTKALKVWNRNHFGLAHNRIASFEKELNFLQWSNKPQIN